MKGPCDYYNCMRPHCAPPGGLVPQWFNVKNWGDEVQERHVNPIELPSPEGLISVLKSARWAHFNIRLH